jgi:hypothetical protein
VDIKNFRNLIFLKSYNFEFYLIIINCIFYTNSLKFNLLNEKTEFIDIINAFDEFSEFSEAKKQELR